MYRYIGSDEIRLAVAGFPVGVRIISVRELKDWIDRIQRRANRRELIPATFVVDSEGYLRIADRNSEHVACAGGEAVLSAGEIFFDICDRDVKIAEISNQSTGYCPEPESWQTVASACDRIPLSHPGCFTTEYIFRRCPQCSQINIVKNELFVCAVCNADLPLDWNCDRINYL